MKIETAFGPTGAELIGLDQTVLLQRCHFHLLRGHAMGNAKAKRGYSRDHRGDSCKQVLVGLAVNWEGFPLAHEVFAGDRHDSTTREEMLTAQDRRVGMKPQQAVVVDRGMSGKPNIDLIEFVVVGREPSPRNPSQKKSTIPVKMR